MGNEGGGLGGAGGAADLCHRPPQHVVRQRLGPAPLLHRGAPSPQGGGSRPSQRFFFEERGGGGDSCREDNNYCGQRTAMKGLWLNVLGRVVLRVSPGDFMYSSLCIWSLVRCATLLDYVAEYIENCGKKQKAENVEELWREIDIRRVQKCWRGLVKFRLAHSSHNATLVNLLF